MKIRTVYILLMFLLFRIGNIEIKAQRFFNLTADDIHVDSIMPMFGYSVPLTGDYQDSVYTVSIAYPDFVDMTDADVMAYKHLTSDNVLPPLPEITNVVSLDRGGASLNISFCPLVYRDNRYCALVSFQLRVYSTPKIKSSTSLTRANTISLSKAYRYTHNSVLATGKWAKIRVSTSGVYQLTDALIRQAGFTNLSNIKVYGYGGNLQNERLTEQDLIDYDDLKEVATCNVGGKRLFYAKGSINWASNTSTVRTRNPYSDYGYYFITENDNEPLQVDSTEFLSSFYPSTSDYHTLHEIDNYAWFQGGRNLFEDTPINSGASKTYTLTSPKGTSSGTLSINITAGNPSQATIALNDSTLGNLNISLGQYDKGNERRAVYNLRNLKEQNHITITTASGGPIRLDYISIAHDIPYPAPNLLTGSFPVPTYVHNITNQNLHAHTAADMIIIIPTSQKLLTQAEQIKAFHEEKDGMRVRIVTADELYNEFSSGTPDANAYRRYLKMLYDRAETEADMPKYLLLFGDCVWDNRMNTSALSSYNADDYLLCFESENSFNEILCYVDDSFFGLLDDGEGGAIETSDKVDVAVGRFPVTTADEAKILVDKTIAYVENKNAGGWQNTLVFMGDDGNNNIHMRDENEVANTISSLYPGYVIRKIMWDAYQRVSTVSGYTYPTVTAAIKQYQNAGALIMDYAGHGNPTQISHEAVLTLNDFKSFNNANLPLWITASCDIMPFDGTTANIGETALLNPNGGAFAFYGTTRTVYASYNKRINRAFLRYVLDANNGKGTTIGEAHRLARNYLITSAEDLTSNKIQYALLGDPAVKLNKANSNIVIDSINGINVTSTSSIANLKAGSLVRISGHIEGGSNTNGLAHITIRGTEQNITGLLNNTTSEGATTAFTYTDRPNTLYTGVDSLKTGKFEMQFALPIDVETSGARGLINLYAMSNDRELIANGYTTNFTMSENSIINNDSIGPSIYCYLNSPSFVDGGNVGTNPYFFTQLYDKDGLNATGTGLGHNMQLVIDGDMHKTYNLNNYFTYDFGSYTTGQIGFTIPTLSVGRHTLTFRAWDVLNNSSTCTLSFNVMESLEASQLDVNTSESVITNSTTTFIVTHNLGSENMDIELEVYDLVGRKVWDYIAPGVSSVGTYTYDWNTIASNGNKLSTGVYVYRAKVTSEGKTTTSGAKKLIINSH